MKGLKRDVLSQVQGGMRVDMSQNQDAELVIEIELNALDVLPTEGFVLLSGSDVDIDE